MAFLDAKPGPLLFGGRRDLATDVAPEQIPDPLAFARPVRSG